MPVPVLVLDTNPQIRPRPRAEPSKLRVQQRLSQRFVSQKISQQPKVDTGFYQSTGERTPVAMPDLRVFHANFAAAKFRSGGNGLRIDVENCLPGDLRPEIVPIAKTAICG
jgi:hypothetical protein